MKSTLKRLVYLFAFLLITAECDASLLTVRPAPNAIHTAISKAHNGDTIVILNGLYREHDIIVQKKTFYNRTSISNY